MTEVGPTQDEVAVIELVGKHGEAWLCDILASALEIRAEGPGTDGHLAHVRLLAAMAAELRDRISDSDAGR